MKQDQHDHPVISRGQWDADAQPAEVQAAIVDGPFTEARELVGGIWFLVASSLDEAAAHTNEAPLAWRKR